MAPLVPESPAAHDPGAVDPRYFTRDSVDSFASRDSDWPGSGSPGAWMVRRNGPASTGRESRSVVPSQRDRHSWRVSRDRWLDEFRRNYKTKLWPGKVQLRLSKIFGGMKISTNTLFPRPVGRPSMELTLSSTSSSNKFVKKIVLEPAQNSVKFCTPSFEIGWLKLQLAVTYNWAGSNWNLSYQAKTKWSKGSRIWHKFQHLESNNFSLSSNWTLKQGFPQLEGSLASHQQPQLKPDIGRLLLEFNLLKASYKI